MYKYSGNCTNFGLFIVGPLKNASIFFQNVFGDGWWGGDIDGLRTPEWASYPTAALLMAKLTLPSACWQHTCEGGDA